MSTQQEVSKGSEPSAATKAKPKAAAKAKSKAVDKAAQAKADREAAKLAKEACQKCLEAIRDKDPELFGLRALVASNRSDQMTLAKVAGKSSKNFQDVVSTMVKFIGRPEFKEEGKALIDKGRRALQKASFEDLFVLMKFGTKEQREAIIEAAGEDSVLHQRSKPHMRLVLALTPKVLVKESSEGFVKRIAKIVVEEATAEAKRGELIEGIQALARACVQASRPGCKVHGDIPTQEYAQVVMGLTETRSQAEHRLLSKGDIV